MVDIPIQIDLEKSIGYQLELDFVNLHINVYYTPLLREPWEIEYLVYGGRGLGGGRWAATRLSED